MVTGLGNNTCTTQGTFTDHVVVVVVAAIHSVS